MIERPLRTSVIGSYPFPGWLEFAAAHLSEFGPVDVREMQEDATVAAVRDQVAAGLDVITDGEQSRLDFNLSFYGYLEGIDLESAPPRRWGPPAHDQRGKHEDRRRAGRAAGAGRRRGIRAAASRRRRHCARRRDAQGEHPRAVHARRPAQSEPAVSRSLRDHRGAVAARA